MILNWKEEAGGKIGYLDKRMVASVWPATTGKHFMFWADQNGKPPPRLFGYHILEEEAIKHAEEIITENRQEQGETQ